MDKWGRHLYQPNKPLSEEGNVTASPAHIALSRQAAREGMVLLKNEKNRLPLKAGAKIALFGKGSFDYVKGGGGSGDVFCPYMHNLYDGLKATGKVSIYEPLADFYRDYVADRYKKGDAPGMMPEADLDKELFNKACAFADTAILVISRFSGEGWDRSSVEYEGEYNPWESETSMPKISAKYFPDTDFYLTAEEKALLADLEGKFDDIVVVLNIGGMMDLSAFKNSKNVASLLLAWQGGMEGGDAISDILLGASPCGKLVDTFADSLDAYPSTANFHESPHYVEYTEDIFVGYRYFQTIPGAKDHIVYPFGYGLSYANFKLEVLDSDLVVADTYEENEVDYSEFLASSYQVQVRVTNLGTRPAKEVLQLYYAAPQGKLGKANLQLGAFAKTRELKAGEAMTLVLSMPVTDLASYDDLGVIKKSNYVIEAGDYSFFVGTSSQDLELVDNILSLDEDILVKELSELCAPTRLTKRLLADGTYADVTSDKTPNDPNECVIEKMVPGTEEGLVPGMRGYGREFLLGNFKEKVISLLDVYENRASMEDFLAQLSDEDLMHLCSGQPNTGVANTWGFGNLPKYGVPSVMTADGPAGLRLNTACGIYTTAWPCATLIASTWDTEIAERIGRAAGEEVKENNIAIWLAPAVNIHRNPMCGRNFEYYSEDPLLTGKMGAAMVRGIQENGIAACVKHFAANNKETNRKQSDSRVSERAFREIYLRGFEIIVKEADPWSIMSSYNIINGHRASENKELLTGILRGEWGFKGAVTTDWWTRGEHYKEILAGNDVKMACGFSDRITEAQKLGAIKREDMESCARRILELIIKLD